MNAVNNLEGKVFLRNAGSKYPIDNPDFHPSKQYPEYPFQNTDAISMGENKIYDSVRDIFINMGLDENKVNTSQWNPLGEFIAPGKKIVIKPNWVSHFVHGNSQHPENILDVLVTHTSILRAVIDYAFIAVGNIGKIIIADAPIQGTDFPELLRRALIDRLISIYRQQRVNLEVIDLRQVYTIIGGSGRIQEHISLEGDPLGYTQVKVDGLSLLTALDEKGRMRYRVYDYDGGQMRKAHGDGKHRYLISNTVLTADFLINLPKLKTHIKTGMTGAMKNLVGINGNKAYLPHYRLGAPAESGDDYAERNFWKLIKSEYRFRTAHWPGWIRDPIRLVGNWLIKQTTHDSPPPGAEADPYSLSGGSWYGNDTAWRMVVDLNRALLYSNQEGDLQETPQRNWLSIVDAVVVGEGEGPLTPSPKPMGLIIAGINPIEVDAVCARLFGFDNKKLGFIREGYPALYKRQDVENTTVVFDGNVLGNINDIPPRHIRPPKRWMGNVELAG